MLLLAALLSSPARALPGRCGTRVGALGSPTFGRPHETIKSTLPGADTSDAIPPPGGLGERDAYDVTNSLSSAHFVVRWGTSGGVDEDDAQEILDVMEYAWDIEVDQMDHPQPYGTDRMRLNVYVVGTGEGPDDNDWSAAYYTLDGDGWPMIAVDRDLLYDHAFMASTCAHELYHALQHASGSYGTSSSVSWYWEATATWVETEVYPDETDGVFALFAFAVMPYLAVNFSSAQTSVEQYYPYGAFIFARYLSEKIGGWEIIRDSWTDPGSRSDPLDALDDALAGWGLELGPVIADMYAHNATWDYEHGEEYLELIEDYLGWVSDDRLADTFGSPGTGGFVRVDLEVLPERYGANMIRLDGAAGGTITADVSGDAEGSSGSTATWHGRLVLDRGDTITYTPIPFDGTRGVISVEAPDDVEAAYLVVMPESSRYDGSETFDYEYNLLHEPPAPLIEELGDFSGVDLGCSATPESPHRPALAGAVLLALGLARRRQ